MEDNTKRLSRLTSILTLLQSKRLVTATFLAGKFGVNVRTIYRDIKALEESGVPIVTEEGKGYSIMEGYRIPPVMFTEREAFALVTAEQIIARNKDLSLRKEFINAISKIKSVLQHQSKEKTELIEKSLVVGKNMNGDIVSQSLIDIQMAISSSNLIDILYTADASSITHRTVQPYLLYHSDTENWVLVAWCELRSSFRSFRLDRITKHTILTEKFEPNNKAFKKYIQEKFMS